MTDPHIDLITLGIRYIQMHPEHLVAQLHWNNEQVWLKRRPYSKMKQWHKVQYIVSKLLRLPIFYPTVSRGGAESLHFEAQRLRLFKSQHIPVPEVYAVTDTFLITENVGAQLHTFLRQADNENKEKYLMRAALALSRLHQSNLSHGRPSLKDMTIRNEQIFFIDLEENALDKMSLPEAQAKDIWLFLASASLHASPLFLSQLFSVFLEHMKPEVLDLIKKIVLRMKPVRLLVSFLFGAHWGRDIRTAIETNIMLETYFETELRSSGRTV